MIVCPECNSHYHSSEILCPCCGHAPIEVHGFPAWAPDLALGGGGFKTEYFAPLAQHEARNFWFRSRNALIVWALTKYFPDFDSLLEVGCGTGYVLSGISAAFPAVRLLGAELFATGLHFAHERIPGAEFVQMDAQHIPYANEFDVVAAFDVIEHIEKDATVLENIHNAIRPGGGLLLTVPQHQWLWSSVDEYACHVRRYSAQELHEKLLDTGFEIVRSTSYVALLLPAMMISRWRGQRNRMFDSMDEFRIGPMLNWGFEKVLTAERILIGLGVDMPIGGTRLIVAKKPG